MSRLSMSEQAVEMAKHITCPKCGEQIPVVIGSLGRKPLNIPVINICDALQVCSSIVAAARELKCSRGYIHKELAKYGVTPSDVIKGRWQPPS